MATLSIRLRSGSKLLHHGPRHLLFAHDEPLALIYRTQDPSRGRHYYRRLFHFEGYVLNHGLALNLEDDGVACLEAGELLT